MATFTALVRRSQKRKDGRYKVIIRVIHRGTEANLKNDWFATDSDIKKDGSLKGQLRIVIEKFIISLYEKCNNNAEIISKLDANGLLNFITNEGDNRNFTLDFVAYVKARAEQLRRDGRDSTAAMRNCAINSLVAYTGKDAIDINSITKKMLIGWFDWILSQPQKGNRKRGRRAPTSYKQQLQVEYKRAMLEYNDEDEDIINIPRNPFAHAIPPKDTAPEKRALSVEQIREIARIEHKTETRNINSRFNLAKDIFLLSFCLMGMNAVDLFNCTRLKGNRIIYERTKTRTRRSDNAHIEVTVPDFAVPIFNKYKDERSDYVFKFHRMYSTPNNFNAAINKGLKEVGKAVGVEGLQFYAARHSWATIAVNDCRIDKYVVHQALNHVDDKTAITDVYIKKDWKITDDANKKVMDYVFNKNQLLTQ